jgi:alpha-N-arabinofuranosidase
MSIQKSFLLSLLFVLVVSYADAQNVITVQADKPTASISPTMWGVFFEDINFSADGGIYAEMVKNRSFEFYKPLMGWKEIKKDGGLGKVLIVNTGKTKPQNPRYAQVTVNAAGGIYALANEGFRGMGVQQGKQYNFSVLARNTAGIVTMKVSLVSMDGKQIASAVVDKLATKWIKNTASLTASATDPKAHLEVVFEGKGNVDIDMVSLFPKDTWKNRPNGLRADLVQMLADLKPGFVRFPGGCIVEGHDLDTRYQWKKTIGNPEDRTQIINRWNTEMRNRQAPDYFQSYGLGFYEYFLLAEDLGAEPLPILNCGMACQFNTSEVAPMDQLEPYVQDALDLVEFANGAATTKWGKLRADMGHPKPFNMKMMGVGNEQWDEQYVERYKVFVKALKAKYPAIELVSTSGPSPDDIRFEYLWKEMRALKADIIDEHYYKEPAWFLKNASRYDNYDRTGPKVFAGEYAAHGKEDKESESRNTWLSALSEAAFMTGLERNADVIQMASYAPLLAHVEAWQWRPDLIWFDNLRSVGTPNYYVQKLFSTNKGSQVVPALQNGNVLNGKDSVYASAVISKRDGEVIIKIVNSASTASTYSVDISGVKSMRQDATMLVLTSPEAMAFNTLEKQQLIYPVENKIKINGNKLQVDLKPMSMNVIKISGAL